MHRREFMEYHKDRFVDHSLLFFKDDKLAAVLPAHVDINVLYSHKGLTYAGIIALAKTENLPAILRSLQQYAMDHHINRVELKLPPEGFHKELSFYEKTTLQQQYAVSKELTDLVINFDEPWKPSSKKTAGYRNGSFDALTISESKDVAPFWIQLVQPQLKQRHNTKPVHTLQEIQLLQQRFPEQILQYYMHRQQVLVAGMMVFDFKNVIKVQYAFANELGFKSKAMEYAYLSIIQKALNQGKQLVDLGVVNNPDGTINKGLQRFKLELGATIVPMRSYGLNLSQ